VVAGNATSPRTLVSSGWCASGSEEPFHALNSRSRRVWSGGIRGYNPGPRMSGTASNSLSTTDEPAMTGAPVPIMAPAPAPAPACTDPTPANAAVGAHHLFCCNDWRHLSYRLASGGSGSRGQGAALECGPRSLLPFHVRAFEDGTTALPIVRPAFNDAASTSCDGEGKSADQERHRDQTCK